VYLRLAREHDVRITHIIETHIHADFVSGAHELKERTGAEIVGGNTMDYRFPLRQVAEGEEIARGSVTLSALHTPGHTPEHLFFLVRDTQQGEEPFGVFTGDALFNLDVGRPDLIGSERELAGQLYRSLFDKLVPLTTLDGGAAGVSLSAGFPPAWNGSARSWRFRSGPRTSPARTCRSSCR